MLELGRESIRYHRETGHFLAQYDFDLIVFVGPFSRYTMTEALASGVGKTRVKYYEDASSCAPEITDLIQKGDYVFIKASRGVGLESILTQFDQAQEAG